MDINIEIETILSNRTKKGMVNFKIEELVENEVVKTIVTQWDLTKARYIRDMLSSAIEAAVSDEMIYQFFIEKVKLDDARASQILLDFREIRQGSKGVINPS